MCNPYRYSFTLHLNRGNLEGTNSLKICLMFVYVFCFCRDWFGGLT